MNPHFPLMIPDASSDDGILEVLAPYDRSVIATTDTADSQAVEKALVCAEKLFSDRSSWLPLAQRMDILEATAQIMQDRFESLAHSAALEGGKPLNDSKVEVARAIDGIKLCVETMRTEAGEEVPMGLNAASSGRIAFTRLEPIGVVVAVSAFNHPLNLIVHQVAPAIATGCPVIVKPAEDTPIACFQFVEILREAGLPAQWCQALTVNDLSVASQLVTDPRVGFFSFIGSAKVGWMLRSQLAAGTRCALEHGGAAPVIIAADADLEETIPLIAKGGFYHAGQVCVSVQRIFVEESIIDQLAEQLVEQAAKMQVGDPTLESSDIGPLIRPAELERVHEWVLEAQQLGARLLCGGKKISKTCYAPTVLLDPPEQARVSSAEIFGPVVCLYRYQDLDTAIKQANSLDVAFQASVFTKDLDLAMEVYSRLDASAVMINDHTAFRVDWMPFAGLKQSGLGVGGIPHTIEDMQIKKLMVIRSSKL